MKKIRLTKNDIDALQEAIDFIESNADGADDIKPFRELNNRLNRIWQSLNEKTRRQKRMSSMR